MKHEESVIQAHIVMELSLLGLYVFMVPNDAAGAISQAKAMRLKAMGLRSGMSDLVVMGHDGRAHFLEIKTASGKLSKNQILFRELCQANGWPYAVARSPEEALTICKGWGIV